MQNSSDAKLVNLAVLLLEVIFLESDAVAARPQRVDHTLRNLLRLLLLARRIILADHLVPLLLLGFLDLIWRVDTLLVELLHRLPLHVSFPAGCLCACSQTHIY